MIRIFEWEGQGPFPERLVIDQASDGTFCITVRDFPPVASRVALRKAGPSASVVISRDQALEIAQRILESPAS